MRSRLALDVDYAEHTKVHADDKGRESTVYELSWRGQRLRVALGQVRHTFHQKGILFVPIYWVPPAGRMMAVGVFEWKWPPTTMPAMDELGKPLWFSFVTPRFFRREIETRQREKDAMRKRKKEEEKQQQHSNKDKDKDKDKDRERDKESERDKEREEGSDAESLYRRRDQLRYQLPSEVQDVFVHTTDFVAPPLLKEESEADARRIEEDYVDNEEDYWVAQWLHNPFFAPVKNEGKGDCLFACIRDAFASIGQQTTVPQLRAKLAQQLDESIFLRYKEQYDSLLQVMTEETTQLKHLEASHLRLKREFRELQTQGKGAASGTLHPASVHALQQTLLRQALQVREQHEQMKLQRKATSELMKRYHFMKGIHSLQHMRQMVGKCGLFRGDPWALSILEVLFGIKFVLLSRDCFEEGDVHHVLQPGEVSPVLQLRGRFQPDFFLVLDWHDRTQYELVRYRSKSMFTYSELPWTLKREIYRKTMEHNGGSFMLIPDVITWNQTYYLEHSSSSSSSSSRRQRQRQRRQNNNNKNNEGDKAGKKEQEEDDDDDLIGMEEELAKMPVVLRGGSGGHGIFGGLHGGGGGGGGGGMAALEDDLEDTKTFGMYDDHTVLQIYSKSGKRHQPYPGTGPGETIPPTQVLDYKQLSTIPQWRQKLSSFWIQPFSLDGHSWASVEHYVQANKFKKGFPYFYRSFALDSGSALSENPAMAKAAGQHRAPRDLRDATIRIDPDFVKHRQQKTWQQALRAKFSQHADLRQALLATNDAKLVQFQKGRAPATCHDLMRLRDALQRDAFGLPHANTAAATATNPLLSAPALVA